MQNTEYASLFQEILNKDIIIRVKVTGNSMKPFLKGNETVTIRKVCSKEINVGDLIFFKDNNELPVLHRIISIKSNNENKTIFVTKGDSLIFTDDPIKENRVLGKVIKIEKYQNGRKIKSINLESPIRKKINFIIALINLFKANIYKRKKFNYLK